MLRAQVISQQNTRTENQNIVTMCHIKNVFENLIKIENIEKYPIFSNENIGYISVIYIGDMYQANRGPTH